jgi:hypothetical protein
MGVPRTLGACSVVPGTPTPAVLAAAGYAAFGTVISAESFSITNGIATITLASTSEPSHVFPTNGYNGPNGYPSQNGTTGSKFDIQGKWPAANGQQVTLWAFSTATYFNGKTVSVLDNNPAANGGAGSFRFYFNHANVALTTDTSGETAPSPFQHYRALRLECSQSMGAGDFIYVGDLNVSSTRYVAALSLAGQLSVEVAGENIPVDRVFLDGTSSSDSVQVSLIY